MTHIQDLQNKANSLADAREILRSWNIEQLWSSARSSEPSTIPSLRTRRCRDSALPHDTLNIVGISGNVFEQLPAREGRASTLFNNSKNLASYSRELRPDTAGNTKSRRVKWDENRKIRQYLFHASKVEVDCWIILVKLILMVVWLILRVFRFRNCILENFLTLWNFNVGKSTSKLKYVQNQQILISHCTGSKKLGCDDCVCIEETSRQACSLPQKSKCRRAVCSRTRPILTRWTHCLHDLRAFPCNRSLWNGIRTLRFVHFSFTEWRRPRLRRSVGSSSIISERSTFRCDLEGFNKSKLQHSVQLQTVLVLYDQGTIRNNGQTSY